MKPIYDLKDPIGTSEITFDEFALACLKPKKGQTSFRVRRIDGGRTGSWIDCSSENGKISVVLPGGSAASTVSEKDLLDWHFVDNGWLVGGKTIRTEYEAMDEEGRWHFNFTSPFLFRPLCENKEAGLLLDALGHDDVDETTSILERYPHLLEEKIRFAPAILQVREGEFVLIHPLHYASYIGSMKCLKLLIKNGANLNSRHSTGKTALIWTCYEHYPNTLDAMRILADAGANLEIGDNEGITPLMWAEIRSEGAKFRYLLEKGANPNVKTKGGMSLLHQLRDPQYLEWLDKYSLDFNAKDRRNYSPLHVAVINRYKNSSPENPFRKIAIELVRRGAKLNERDENGDTPLDIVRRDTGDSFVQELRRIASENQ